MFGFGKKKKKVRDEDQKPAAEAPQEAAVPGDANDSTVEALEDRVLTGKIVRQGGRLRVKVDETGE